MSSRPITAATATLLGLVAAAYPIVVAGSSLFLVVLATAGLAGVLGAIATGWRLWPALAIGSFAVEQIAALAGSNAIDLLAPLAGLLLLLLMHFLTLGDPGTDRDWRETRFTLLAGLGGYVVGQAGLLGSVTWHGAIGPSALLTAAGAGLGTLAVTVTLLRRGAGVLR